MRPFATLSSLLGLTALSGLAACAHAPPAYEASAVERGQEIFIPASDGAALSSTDRAQVASFVSSFNAANAGELMVIEVPDANGLATAPSADAIVAALKADGVSPNALVLARAEAPSEQGGVRLAFTRFEAVSPECPPMNRVRMNAVSGNRAYPGFGCAVEANIAAMIADPADLAAPADMTPADSARRVAVLDKYRKGEPTSTKRTDDERGAISSVVQ